MGQVLNGIEVIQPSKDNNDYRVLPAVVTDVWEQDAVLYWDTTANAVKKFAPADASANATNQGNIIGIAQSGKKSGEDTAVVAIKAILLGDSTAGFLGAKMVVKLSGKYSFNELANYNTIYDPDVTGAVINHPFTAAAESNEADGRLKIALDGTARLKQMT